MGDYYIGRNGLEWDNADVDEPEVAHVASARLWIRSFCVRTQGESKDMSSYGLKHVAEKHMGYITNGAFILAATLEGYTVYPINKSPNANFNMMVKNVKPSDFN